jgi:predicted nucleic acid-binding protein
MNIKAYIDTNVYMDFLEEREDSEIARLVMFFLEKKGVPIYVNDISIINIHYITRNTIDRKIIEREIKKILNKHKLVSIDKEIIENSFDSEFKDFEDGVQYFCAKRAEADFILTRNKKDFQHSEINTLTPQEFYDNYIL